MATLPRFVFLSTKESEFPESTSARKERPQIQLNTRTGVREGYTLSVPGRRYSRPLNLRTITTPPDSPTRTRSSTMGSQDPPKMHDSGALTPPATPTKTTHSKTSSASSDFLSALSDLRRGDSVPSLTERASLDESARPGSTELLVFPHHLTDYELHTNSEGRTRPIGSGAFSDVYLATPSLPHPSEKMAASVPPGPALSPPITPVHSRGSSSSKATLPSIPPLYAIKTPNCTSAKKVLDAEARILSYLFRYPDAADHIVPFFGQDSRSGALVLQGMSGTLESWIETNLNTLDEASRDQKLAAIFPTIALSLIDTLAWMHAHDCIHADIKPSNILVSTTATTSSPPHLVYSDFSSSILPTHPSSTSPLGAGTWDFLDPSLLSSSSPGTPSAPTDVWSLAITLLFVVLGTSPYEGFRPNKFQHREMVKSGAALQCAGYGDAGAKNMRTLKAQSKALGFDVAKWFGKVLVKGVEKRVSLAQWRDELVKGSMATARM